MWPNLRIAGFHTHNSMAHFTLSNNIKWQFWQVSILKITQAAFAVAYFWGMSDIHKCLGGLQMPPSPLDKRTVGCNSPDDWLMSLAMDLADWCVIRRWKWHQWMPFGCFHCWYSLFLPPCGYLSTPTLPLYRSASGIGCTSKKVSKMVGNWASYLLNS